MDKIPGLKILLTTLYRHINMLVTVVPGCAVIFTVLAFTSFPVITFAQSSWPGIHVEILEIKNSRGKIACALFESPEGFPSKFLHYATNIVLIEIRNTRARCNFAEIPEGTYALAVIHDENMNGKFDTNWLGIPREGYGFSNDVKVRGSAPSFDAAGFRYEGQTMEMTITLNY